MVPPYAKLLVALNGGANQTGGILAAFGDTVRLRSEHTATVQSFRFEIYAHPVAFPCPAGWSTAADGYTYYFAASATPPDFTLPSDHSQFGKFLLGLTINGGDPGVSGLPATQFVDESTAVEIISDSGVQGVAWREGEQFSPLKYVAALQLALSLLDQGLGGGFGSASIADHSVTYVKIQTVAASSLIGNPTGVTANAQAIGVNNGLGFSGSNLGIVDGGVNYARIQDVSAASRVLGRGSAGGAGDVEELTVGGGLEFNATQIRLSALTGDVTNAAGGGATVIGTNKVTLAMQAQVATARFLGRVTAATGNVEALTGTQATTLLDAFTSGLKGLVPASGGGTTNFLRADGTFAAPTATATPAGSTTQLQYNNAGALGGTGGITFPGANRLAFAAETTNSNLQFEHNTVIAKVRNQANSAYVPALTWGAANDELVIGDGTGSASVATIRSRVEAAGSYIWEVVTGTSVAALTSAGLALTPVAATGTVVPSLKITGAAHTALTASTERHAVQFDLSSTKQFATGALTTQREARLQAPTYGFVGASVITTAATLAISGAPIAGTNATITQSLALWLETGSLAFGSSAALSGLTRIAHNVAYLVGRSSTSTDLNLVRWGSVVTDGLTLGDDAAVSVFAYASTTFGVRLGGATEWAFTTTQLDANNNNLVNLFALNGTRVATGALGTALTDANETLSVAGGNVYEQTTALTGNRSKGLAVTGSPTNGEVISIRRFTTAAFTLTINDEVGNPLYVFPAGQARIADFSYSSATNKFVLLGHMKLTP